MASGEGVVDMKPEKDKDQDVQSNVKMNKDFVEGTADSR
jgi:hypothetical protein